MIFFIVPKRQIEYPTPSMCFIKFQIPIFKFQIPIRNPDSSSIGLGINPTTHKISTPNINYQFPQQLCDFATLREINK